MRSSTTTFLEHHWECLFVKWNIMLAMHLTYVLAPRLCLLLYWSRCIAPLLYQSVQATVWENLKSKKLSCHLAYVDIYVDESSRLKSITSTSNFSLSPFNFVASFIEVGAKDRCVHYTCCLSCESIGFFKLSFSSSFFIVKCMNIVSEVI